MILQAESEAATCGTPRSSLSSLRPLHWQQVQQKNPPEAVNITLISRK
jgi:hypothetical protein